MTIAVLHLTDIHTSKDSDAILRRGPAISAAVNRYLYEASELLIIISGDIAQSGQEHEYNLARNFLIEIKTNILIDFPGKSIQFLIAPGNHDCDFSEPDQVRDIILESIESRSPDIPEKFIAKCTECQENFFNFRKSISNEINRHHDDKLWTTYKLIVEEKVILIDSLNASWMSSRHEQQGGLLYPFERYNKFNSHDADLRIGILHHPFGWYSQRNQLRFRAFMHGLCDVIFTGHEHDSSARISDDLTIGECAYVEGTALFERSNGKSGFNVILLDLKQNQFQYSIFDWVNNRYEIINDPSWTNYRQMPKRAPSDFSFSSNFLRELSDPGATLRHPSGRELVLEDIYVFPDLDVRDNSKDETKRAASGIKLSAKYLLQLPRNGHSALIEGVENSGKTRLLYQLASNYQAQGFLPVYISGNKLHGSQSDSNIESILKAAISTQYNNRAYESFIQASKSKKVLLLDDFDACRLNGEFRAKMLNKLAARFITTILTVSEDYEFSEILNSAELGILSSFKSYIISPFGYQRRGDLIRKWMALGATEETSKNDLLQMEDDATKLVESARLQHVASSVPIYVLSLLQGSASGLSKELHNSSFANYYHFLIVGALERGRVPRDAMPTFIAACTHLSWFVKQNGLEQQITEQQFKRFVTQYSEEWTATTPSILLETLLNAKILKKDGDSISFSYPYAYYYFLGRYTSITHSDIHVKEYLNYCMDHLYVRECANTLLFLSHHAGTSEVLDQLVKSLQKHFSDLQPVNFSKADVEKISNLVLAAPQLQYKETKPEAYRNEQERWQDDNDTGCDGLKDQPVEKKDGKDLIDEIVSLTKSIEIAGALLSHQFPNYTRTKKNIAIEAIFDAAMRAVRRYYMFFEEDADELIQASAARLARKRPDIPREKVEQQIRLAVGWLLRAISTGLVLRAGSSLTAPQLTDNVQAVLDTNPSNANRLIRISQALSKPTPIPRTEIESLVRAESKNPCVMGILQSLILHRIYMYQTRREDRDWAFSIFKIEGHAKSVEIRHNRMQISAK